MFHYLILIVLLVNKMKFNCFYEVNIIRGKRTRTEKWGYFPYSIVKKDVKELYKDGANNVILKKITEKEFNKK